MSLSVYKRGLSANSSRIIMAADRLVWLARPSCKCPEAQKGTDCLQKSRKCRCNNFEWLLQSSIVHRLVFLRSLSFRSYMSLESALIAQTAQEVCDGQTDPQTKHITPVAQSRTGNEYNLH